MHVPLTLATLHPLPEGEGKVGAIPSPPAYPLFPTISLSSRERARVRVFG